MKVKRCPPMCTWQVYLCCRSLEKNRMINAVKKLQCTYPFPRNLILKRVKKTLIVSKTIKDDLDCVDPTILSVFVDDFYCVASTTLEDVACTSAQFNYFKDNPQRQQSCSLSGCFCWLQCSVRARWMHPWWLLRPIFSNFLTLPYFSAGCHQWWKQHWQHSWPRDGYWIWLFIESRRDKVKPRYLR